MSAPRDRQSEKWERGFHPHVPCSNGKASEILSGLCLHGKSNEDRESWMCGFSKGHRLFAQVKERENAQRCVNVDKVVNETITSIIVQALTVAESDQEVKFDQEASTTDVKFTRSR